MRRSSGRSAAVVLAACVALAGLRPALARGQVKAWEGKITIPTYEAGPAEPNPIFYSGRAYQGAKGPIYPYPLLDKLSDVKRDKTYRILYLENEYVRIGVLPEIGGRIFEAVDKTNGYDFVYRQHVIKPALIGMLGAWISGGVEWNIPHHHRATTFMPVDAALIRGCDGSAAIWVGEIELRQRMKWIVGLTLRPGSSVLEVTTRVFNRTPFAHSMLAFANVAVHTNESYQVLFPPSTEIATFHGKNQFSRWPVSTEVFNGQDYTRGVDVSWWKGHLTPTSFFAFDAEGDFLGGYDHVRQAGVVFVGDHHVVPGKKLWTWGTGSEGKTWERILTDSDGPYLELMIGSWSDNQPDYSWIKPGETRSVTQFWYPVRGLGGLKNANRNGACELAVKTGKARIVFNATSKRKQARCLLRSGARILFEKTLDIGPGEPFLREVGLPAGVEETSLVLELVDADGREIIAYAPRAKKNPPLPQPVSAPVPPKDVPTNEELYLWGQRLEQFHNPVFEPYPYYEEALRRDPSDVRANTALAVLGLKRGKHAEAEALLRTALARLTFNYTRPKDGETAYYLGVACRRLGKSREAEDAFERASWDPAWQAASFYELAEMASTAGAFPRALEYVERSLRAGGPSPRSIGLQAALLRRLRQTSEAYRKVNSVRYELDPLDDRCSYEAVLITMTGDLAEDDSSVVTRPDTEPQRQMVATNTGPGRLELALDYLNCGMWDEAASVFAQNPDDANPLDVYVEAYACYRAGLPEKARALLARAASLPPDLVFPHALEFVEVLEWAAKTNPADGRAPCYLGNLLFDLQPERALAAWERAREVGPPFSAVYRNLGLAYARLRNDLPAAIVSLEKALATNPGDARLYYELDVLCEAAGIDPEARLDRLEKNHEIVSLNDNALAREVGLLVGIGRGTRALEILRSRHFHVWEGGGEIHGLWIEANLTEGRRWSEKKDGRRALDAFKDALSYPANLDVGPPSSGPGSPKIYAHLGQAHAWLGNAADATACYNKAVAFRTGLSEQAYYRALALRELGRPAEAEREFENLARGARDVLAVAPAADFFEKFGERQSARSRRGELHYLCGLGLLGLGKTQDAAEEFSRALEADPGHREARRFLKK